MFPVGGTCLKRLPGPVDVTYNSRPGRMKGQLLCLPRDPLVHPEPAPRSRHCLVLPTLDRVTRSDSVAVPNGRGFPKVLSWSVIVDAQRVHVTEQRSAL